jgi:outer membrane protein insertion porin family
LYSGKLSLTHDTRDIPFAPTEGHMFELSFEQVFGDFDYSRAELDYRKYFLLHERPDGSGRHTLGNMIRLGFSGKETPVFERFYAGGFSTMRGFEFRGASPSVSTVRVGGDFMFLGSTEYMFPLTADDMLKGALFVDYGTIEQDIEIRGENFRVAPGFGFRISVPALGPAPLAFDFAFPIAKADTDEERMFTFFFGMGR